MNIEFLGWDKKLPDAIADKLLEEGNSWDGLVVVVPTEESAKRLRISLIERAENHAVILPQIMTPPHLLNAAVGETDGEDLALRIAWARVISQVKEPNELIRILPQDRSFSWSMQMAALCLKARQALHEDLKSFEDVLKFPDLPLHETERWQLLAEWEEQTRQILADAGLNHLQDDELKWAKSPSLPQDVSRVVIAGDPDPLPILIHGLSELAASGAIELSSWVYAPEGFPVDSWGRPVESEELNTIDLPDGESPFELSSGASEMVEQIVSWFAEEGVNNTQCAIGCCDSAFANSLTEGIEEAGWKVYRASGYEASRTGIARLLSQIEAVVENSNDWQIFEPLCRSTLLAEALNLPDTFKVAKKLDRLDGEHIPSETSFVLQLLKADGDAQAIHHITTIQNWLNTWQEGNVGFAAQTLAQNLRQANWAGKFQDKLLKKLEEWGRRIADLEQGSLQLSYTEAMSILTSSISRDKVYTDRDDSDLIMQDWLELSFERADYIALTGMHEGCVPDTNVEDALLPDHLRSALHLRNRASRVRKDAFLFKGLIESRRHSGGLRIFVSKVKPSGDSCVPSSLLMKCSEAELPQRALKLFRSVPDVGHKVSRSAGNRPIAIPCAENPWAKRVAEGQHVNFSPSAYASFLRCPRRFWLQRVNHMEELVLEHELNEAQIGVHIHACAERLGPNGDLFKVYDERILLEELQKGIERDFKRNYGEHLTLPVMLQLDDLSRRLKVLVDGHLEALDEGWQVINTEHDILWEAWNDLPVNIKMRVDRIEYHPAFHLLRVVDFKTSKKAKTPQEKHIDKVSGAKIDKFMTELPYLPLMEEEGKKDTVYKRWTELQLPLYVLAVAQDFKELGLAIDDIRASYFNLPLDQNNSGYQVWEDLSEEKINSAFTWARAITEKLLSTDGTDLPWCEDFGGTTYPDDPFTHLAPAKVSTLFQTQKKGDE